MAKIRLKSALISGVYCKPFTHKFRVEIKHFVILRHFNYENLYLAEYVLLLQLYMIQKISQIGLGSMPSTNSIHPRLI